MLETDLIILQEVHSQEEAMDLEAILTANNIGCKIIHLDASFDAATGLSTEEKLTIQVLRTDYERARDVLIRAVEDRDGKPADDHYFHSYTEDELLEVLKSEDDWSPEDVVYARKLLTERNISWDEEKIYRINEEKRDWKDRPESVSNANLIIGFIFAFLGGLFGIFMGLYLMAGKKDDRYGNRVFYYDAKTRRAGGQMFWIGFAVFLTAIVIYIFKIRP